MQKLIYYIKKYGKIALEYLLKLWENYKQEVAELKEKAQSFTPLGAIKSLGKETKRFFVSALVLAGLKKCSNKTVHTLKEYVQIPYEECLTDESPRPLKIMKTLAQQILHKQFTGCDYTGYRFVLAF